MPVSYFLVSWPNRKTGLSFSPSRLAGCLLPWLLQSACLFTFSICRLLCRLFHRNHFISLSFFYLLVITVFRLLISRSFVCVLSAFRFINSWSSWYSLFYFPSKHCLFLIIVCYYIFFLLLTSCFSLGPFSSHLFQDSYSFIKIWGLYKLFIKEINLAAHSGSSRLHDMDMISI